MKNTVNTYKAFPKAECLLEALRGMDYTLSSAIADLIDNSITAGATIINLYFHLSDKDAPNPIVAIADNGCGMSRQELLNAMRLGVINPKKQRRDVDLGRFGLGLKTASLSQCRKLTVYSVQNGCRSCLCWDLNKVSEISDNDGWNILEGTLPVQKDIQACQEKMDNGVLVVWEDLDRSLPSNITENELFDAINSVELYLSLYFHRFLEGLDGCKLQINVNNKRIKPLNPFLKQHPATRKYPLQHIGRNANVQFCGYILPHKDKLTKEELSKESCIDGWVAHEGFFVYRNNRLLLPGGWLGLGNQGKQKKRWIQDELHQLVRIELNISNLCDEDWKIDIRKSSARPPLSVRTELTKLAERIREDARNVYVFRGSGNSSEPEILNYLWIPVQNKAGKLTYRINVDHPIIASLLSDVGQLSGEIRNLLTLLEKTVPVQRIWLDSAEGKEFAEPEMDNLSASEMREYIKKVFKHMVLGKGKTPDEVQLYLSKTPPFHLQVGLIEAIRSDFQQ